MRRRGFTLIELLVVIAIIAILAAILFPVFVSVRERARQSACLSNMSQLGKAFKLYLDDNNGRFPMPGDIASYAFGHTLYGPTFLPVAQTPPLVCWGDWIWFDGTWTKPAGGGDLQPVPWMWRANPAKGSLWKYTNKSRKIYVCPSDKHANWTGWTSVDGQPAAGFGLSYDLNHNLYAAEYGTGGQGQYVYSTQNMEVDKFASGLPAYESEILRPTKTVMLADHGDGSINTDPQYAVSFAKYPIYNNRHPLFDGVYRWWQESPTPVHCGGQNWVFCDGHAKWCTLKQWRELSFYRSGNKQNFCTNKATSEYLQ